MHVETPRHKKRLRVFIMEWSWNCKYKLSKCIVEQLHVRLSMVLKESKDGSCFTLRGRGFQRRGPALQKLVFQMFQAGILQLYLPNPSKPRLKSRMKM